MYLYSDYIPSRPTKTKKPLIIKDEKLPEINRRRIHTITLLFFACQAHCTNTHPYRLIRVTQGISATLYGYNGDSDRLWQNTNGVTTTFTLDLNGALAQVLEQTQGGQTSSFLPGIGQESNGGLWYFYHTDALGSVRHMSGVTGGSIGDVKYSPFGEIVDSTGIMPWFGFTGEQQDSTSGLTYLRSRYYNPALGRFLTPDSLIPDITNGQASNAYAYVYNDPINLVDPSGHFGIGRETIRAGISSGAEQGIYFLNWYTKKPDNCSCKSSQFVKTVSAITDLGANPAAQLAGAHALTSIPVVITGDIEAYKIAKSGITRMLKGSGVNVGTGIDITELGIGPLGKANPYINSTGFGSGKYGLPNYYLENAGGSRAGVIRNIRSSALAHEIAGAAGVSGIIDGGTQIFKDIYASNLCLSPEEIAWRSMVALGFGIVAGAGGAFVAGVAATAGVTGFAVTVYGWGGSLFVGSLLSTPKRKSIAYFGNMQ